MLKGRLHQAVTLAQLGAADRWPRIKALAEDVLQRRGAEGDGRMALVRYPLVSSYG